MSHTGTLRGTPNRGRGGIPFSNSPAANSSIPRPVAESHNSTASEAGSSTMSVSRQKQNKRDEVGHVALLQSRLFFLFFALCSSSELMPTRFAPHSQIYLYYLRRFLFATLF